MSVTFPSSFSKVTSSLIFIMIHLNNCNISSQHCINKCFHLIRKFLLLNCYYEWITIPESKWQSLNVINLRCGINFFGILFFSFNLRSLMFWHQSIKAVILLHTDFYSQTHIWFILESMRVWSLIKVMA